jgi:glycosyltransferase involved in cell wall biosynthesis
VTIHEATYRLHPEMHPRRGRIDHTRAYLALYGWSGRHADAVIASSEAAKQDVATGYGVPAERIHVVRLAPSEVFREVADEAALADARQRHLGADIPFFLHVGKLSPIRNVPAVIEAFAQAKRSAGLPHRLLLVGTNELGLDVHELAARHGVADHVIRPGFVNDDDLVLLYNAATAFVLPYAYQTVSLPPLEAMACGTPVITVGTQGMREVTGGAARYVSRPDVGELAGALAELATDPLHAAELVTAGRVHLAGLSWQRAAAETLDVLVGVATS